MKEVNGFAVESGTLVRYTGSGSAVVIPKGIMKIGEGAFEYKSGVTSVTIPASVKVIENRAFCGSGLRSVQIPETVRSIGKEAFFSCRKLTSVEIGGGIERINDRTFCDCRALEKVVFGKNVKTIDRLAFADTGLVSVELPEGLKELEAQAFSDCPGLRSVRFPASLRMIGEGAFLNCAALESLDLPEKLAAIGIGAFSGCGVKSVSLPEGLRELSASSFSQCAKLESVSLPDAMESIGDEAFCECENLTEIQIPKGVRQIGKAAFSGCTSLREWSVAEGNPVFRVSGNFLFEGADILNSCLNSVKGELFIPKSVRVVGPGAFARCRELTGVNIPPSVQIISEQAFYHCEKLNLLMVEKGLKEIQSYAFSNCDQLVDVVLPETVITVESMAFHLTGLRRVTIYSSILALSSRSFAVSEEYDSPENKRILLIAPNLTVVHIPDHFKDQAMKGFLFRRLQGEPIRVYSGYVIYIAASKRYMDVENHEDLLRFALEEGIVTAKEAEQLLVESRELRNEELTTLLTEYLNSDLPGSALAELHLEMLQAGLPGVE